MKNTKPYTALSPLLLFISLWLILNTGCEKLFYTEPILYPESFTFTGTVYSPDSLAVPKIRIVLKTPLDEDSVVAFTNATGTYSFVRTLEFAGPNKMFVRDIDGADNGGHFNGIDTMFYIRDEDWDTKVVRYDFFLEKR